MSTMENIVECVPADVKIRSVVNFHVIGVMEMERKGVYITTRSLKLPASHAKKKTGGLRKCQEQKS